jgi:predicted Rossmann-fold nucleotide-binding protein
VLSWASLGLHAKPVGLLNVSGYFDHLLAFLDESVARGLAKPAVRELLVDDDRAERLLERILAPGV